MTAQLTPKVSDVAARGSALVDVLAVIHDEPGTPLRELALEQVGLAPHGVSSVFLAPSILLLDELLLALEDNARLTRDQALERLRRRIAEWENPRPD